MGKLKSENLRLNLIINGDAGHKEILSLQRSMKDTKLAIKKTYLEQLYLSAIRTECSHCSLPECHLDQAKRMERSLDYARDDNQGWQKELYVKTAGKTAFLRTKHCLESKMAEKCGKSRVLRQISC